MPTRTALLATCAGLLLAVSWRAWRRSGWLIALRLTVPQAWEILKYEARIEAVRQAWDGQPSIKEDVRTLPISAPSSARPSTSQNNAPGRWPWWPASLGLAVIHGLLIPRGIMGSGRSRYRSTNGASE